MRAQGHIQSTEQLRLERGLQQAYPPLVRAAAHTHSMLCLLITCLFQRGKKQHFTLVILFMCEGYPLYPGATFAAEGILLFQTNNNIYIYKGEMKSQGQEGGDCIRVHLCVHGAL